MNTIIVALLSAFIATTMGVLLLRRHSRSLKVREQTFRFHELRDRLQLLAVDGRIALASPAYKFLEFTINLSIRNAGVMKLSELLKLSKLIDRKMQRTQFHDVLSDFHREGEEVQKLAADTFRALSSMLITNDDFTFILAQTIELTAKALKGVARDTAKELSMRILPGERSQAVYEARKYRKFGDLLSSGHAA